MAAAHPRESFGKFVRRLPWFELACVACGLLGVVLRLDYALHRHHPRHAASSDALEYIERAQTLVERGAGRALSDTIWPPGTSALWALLSAADDGQQLTALFNACASVLSLLLTAASAALLAGRRAGALALAFAGLHFGFIHYTGYFLAEQPFQLCVAFALWLSLSALVAYERGVPPPLAATTLSGLAVGLAWGLSALFRPNALPVFAGGALALTLLVLIGVPRRALGQPERKAAASRRGALALGAGSAAGLALVLAAAAQRCTSVAGRFCGVSNNLAMNFALGQAGPVFGLEFRDPIDPALTTAWVPPALLHHHYEGMGSVPASIYDTPGILRWVGGRFVDSPSAFLTRAIGNALDLFGLEYWPKDFGFISERAVLVWTQLFFAIVLVPALYGLARLVVQIARGHVRRSSAVFVAGGALGLGAASMVALGEARYRVPFDGLFIALAAGCYARDPMLTGLNVSPAPRAAERVWPAWALLGGACAALLLGVSHPALNSRGLGARDTFVRWGNPKTHYADAGTLGAPADPNLPWDAPGNFIWHCTPGCPELRLRLDRARAAQRVTLSVDNNDRYRLSFYRGSAAVGHVDIPIRRGQPGLQIAQPHVPESVSAFDAVGVQPLYGDGIYALGHLSVD